MNFIKMRDLLIEHLNEMTKDINFLFTVQVDKDEMWSTYLNSFNETNNPIFRELEV